MDWLNFIEKLYYIIVDLFCRYKSDNNTNIVYIKCSQQQSQSLETMISYPVFGPAMYYLCSNQGPAMLDRMTGTYKEADFKHSL